MADEKMSRTFEDAGVEKKRKWQCFVCGNPYDSYEEYKNHIITEHDEGREYLTCPVCQCPVRDLKMHWRAKHPQRPFPKGVAVRVAVWHDFKPGGKKTTRKPKFRQGTFCSKKSGCDFHYRSGMEEEFYNLLEQDQDVESFFAEPFKVPYFYANEWHDYIPDIRVNFADGSTEIWEIKPSSQLHFEQNKAKWVSMNDHAANLGWQFVVQTEDGLETLRRKVRKQHFRESS